MKSYYFAPSLCFPHLSIPSNIFFQIPLMLPPIIKFVDSSSLIIIVSHMYGSVCTHTDTHTNVKPTESFWLFVCICFQD